MESKTEAVSDIANFLFNSGLTIQEYEDLQNRRKERLNLWLDRRIEYVAKSEMELIAKGEEILIELKKLYKLKI